ncbi:MAG: PorT family protein [Bacteroidales bacterium]|nr:PorT family protein [Bacteroidales bacterium]
MKKVILMKRVLLLSVLLVGLSVCANAQFNIGIKVAANATNYNNQTRLFPGVDAGLFLRFGDRFYFQPEVCYSFKNTKLTDASTFVHSVQENVKLHQHFIDVPALLGYHFINKEKFKFHLFIGPRFGFRIGSNLKEIDPLVDQEGKMQWAGQVGLGFDLGHITLDARYDFAADKLIPNRSDNYTWKQNSVVVSLGIKFLKN